MSGTRARCPKCGAPMVRKYSSRYGRDFLSCGRFPACRGAASISRADPGRPIEPGATRRAAPPRSRASAPARRSPSPQQPIADEPHELAARLVRLIRFYDSCLEREGLRELRFLPRDEGSIFVSLTVAPGLLLGGQPLDLEAQDEIGARLVEFVRRRKVGAGARRLYLGYPIVVLPSDDRDARELVPLTYARLDVAARGPAYRLSLEEAPQVNYLLLERSGLSLEEAVALGDEIEKLEEGATEGSWEATLVEQVARISSEARLTLEADISPTMASAVTIQEATFEAVIDMAVLFQADRVGYTVSVRTELERLADAPDQARTTPIEAIVLGERLRAAASPPADLVAVTPLSEAQRTAVASALAQPLTVVTGPPGTGKSQLVLNVIANALVRDETVLFASRNNKAVDVVCDRFKGLTEEAALLRTGRASYRDSAIALMHRVVSGVRSPTPGELEHARAELERNRRRRHELEKLARAWAEAQASVARAAAAYEAVVGASGTVAQQLAESTADAPEWAEAGRVLETKLERLQAYAAGRRSLPERLLRLISHAYPLGREREEVRGLAHANPSLFAADVQPEATWEELTSAVRTARDAVGITITRTAWAAGVTSLGDLPAEADVQRDLAELEEDEAQAGREFVRLSRQAALGSLAEADRQGLERYLRVVQQLAGPELIGRQMYAKLKNLEQALFRQIQRAFPVWALTSLTARRNLPMTPGLFDLVVIDEASQCDLPSALALLLRGKRAMVIGDDKQLIHVTPLDKETEHALAQEAGLTAEELVDFSYRDVSLFSRARHVAMGGSGVLLLDEHYRSDPDIISFSNERFYGGRLRIYTEQDRLAAPASSGERAVQWIDVRGETVRPPSGSARNDAEAHAAAAEVRRLVDEAAGRRLSIGVVTPFRLQKELVARLVADRLTAEEIERHEVVVDTAHGFQGDERDVMIFSTVIAHGAVPRSVEFVNANEHLFNVAVTRARSRLLVVGDRGVCTALGGLLGDLARYVADLEARLIADRLEPGGSFDTDEERRLFELLCREGITVRAHEIVRGMEIDLTVEGRNARLAIEIDGSSHEPPDGTRYLSDMRRDLKLRHAGWQVLRFPAWQVRLEPDRCLSQVKAIMGSG